nr:MAG TPA: hypothetical protein [Caudoviricetes sp.]DAV89960.1 MAG TPA: hypothetical protein [Caudoviricetes sp.]
MCYLSAKLAKHKGVWYNYIAFNCTVAPCV